MPWARLTKYLTTILRLSYDNVIVTITGAVPAMKPEATAIFAPQDGRWKITVSFLMGAGFAYRNLGIKQTVYWILAASKG